MTLDESRSQTVNGGVGATLVWLSAKAAVEAELQRTLSVAIGSTHLFEEEFSITVPERTAVRIALRWKHVVQCGSARLMLPNGTMYSVLYRAVLKSPTGVCPGWNRTGAEAENVGSRQSAVGSRQSAVGSWERSA
ncbi:hypothetical protein [Kitasatospora sp. NPDC051164]|uniref:hypothetical protein n=1 Tax=Kitasatospora sp. NPDC051164 TaxID=3364055 RepID=UPI00379EFABA